MNTRKADDTYVVNYMHGYRGTTPRVSSAKTFMPTAHGRFAPLPAERLVDAAALVFARPASDLSPTG